MAQVTRVVPFLVGDVHGEATLSWEESDPWAVHADIGGQQWALSREVLRQGMTERAGGMDAVIEPDPLSASAVIRLTGVSGRGEDAAEMWCEIIVSRPDIWAFLRATWAHVPEGAETIPDDEWGKLLRGERE